MDQRVVTEADAPDFESDPVEKPLAVASADEFISRLGDNFVNPTPDEVDEFKTGGFVRALHVTRFEPDNPEGTHTRNARHIFSLTMQFDSEQSAQDVVDIIHQDSLRPCPETCAQGAEEFDVADIPDATGSHRFATEESIEAIGDPDEMPFDAFQILFADGVFAYSVLLSGPPGEVSEGEAEEIAKSLYDRVKGAPAA